MALQEAPSSIDVTDIQFKAHSKYQLFNVNASTSNHNGIDLLATASTFGLVIVGRPTAQEIQVLRLKDIVENKESPTVPVRTIGLPGEPYMIALSCDHNMLSVCYTVNGTTFIDIFAVQTFLSANIQCILSKIMVSNANGVRVNHILWNPVIANTMVLCLNDGTLTSYVFKSNSFEYNALDKAENARCACWSPKGKQIVVAFPNGKLAQYKPDLKLAKAIPCATQICPGPFYPIFIQWLSTYQFAVVFVENKEDSSQSLFIINTSKTAPPTYINYYDITYSQTGPRAPQVFLVHILQWNLLLMASSNGTEIGILGTTESGENPLWKQYIFIDEGRAELPLTADKQDTFPIGLDLETGCTHQLTIGENLIPVMPMLHILSTHGFIISFNLLNFQSNRVDICSPPQNISDQSGLGLFKQNVSVAMAQKLTTTPPSQHSLETVKTQSSNDYQVNNLTFNIPETGATSTPAKPPQSSQTKLTFGIQTTEAQQPKPTMNCLFSGKQTTGFGSSGFELEGAREQPKPFVQSSMQPTTTLAPAPTTPQNNAVKMSSEANKPFLTVQSNYKPTSQANKSATSSIALNSEYDAILRKLIKEEIEAFDTEIRAVLSRSKNVQINICGKEELSKLMKNIEEMQEITTQATESTESIKSDVNSLRLTLYEMHAMMSEAQSKVEEFNKKGKTGDGNMAANQTHRRLINKLQNQLAQNQARFDVFSKQLDANWSAHLQKQRENDKARMRIPTLENVYQTLEQQHQILTKEKAKINKIKSKIGVRDISPNKIKYSYSNTDNLKMNSLVDSVLSLTISDQIRNEQKPLNPTKLNALRKATLASRKINAIKPSRPDRQGLNSEIIIEKKLAHAKAQKEKENLKNAEYESERKRQEELARQKELAKPNPLLPTPTTQSVAAPAKPKEVVEKQTLMSKPLTTASPLSSSTGTSMFGSNTSKLSFGSPQIATTPAPAKGFDAKSVFGSEPQKSQLSFRIGEEISNQKPEPTMNLSTALGKDSSFNPSTPSGLTFGAKTVLTSSGLAFPAKAELTVTVPSSTKSSGFSFGATSISTSTPAFGSMTQTNSVESQPKAALLQTPTPTSKEPFRNAPIVATGANISPKQTTKTPLLATPPNIQPLQTNDQTTANSSPFKFNIGDTFATNTIADKLKSDKENTPIVTGAATATITNTSSIGSFSFLSGLSNTSTSPAKPNTPTVSTVQAPSALSPISAVSISTPASTVTSSTPSSVGFSFAKANAETSLFSGVQTAVTTMSTSTVATTAANVITSSSDVGSIFKGFNICNVADNSNSGKSIFGGNAFGSLGGGASLPASTSAPIFGSVAQPSSTSPQTSPFGNISITTSASTPPTTSTKTSLFGAKAPDTTSPQSAAGANIFGSKSVENASVSFGGFGITSPPASSTASPSASTGNLFGSVPAPKPAGNVFGGTIGSSNTSTASIFGGSGVGSPAPPQSAFGSSVFSNANNTTNIFGGVATSNDPVSTAASIFGRAATNPSSGGSIFAGSGFSSPKQSSPGSAFAASTFGGSFGAQTTTSASVFGGSFSQESAFGSPFGQQSPQPQTGFGSPQQQSGGFGLSAIAAQSNPTFGSSATFGSGPASFGSPKGAGFGTFANANPNTSFTTPPKSNSLFESLGSSDNAMTFGNLAQNASAAPKQFSGGSSFSSWR